MKSKLLKTSELKKLLKNIKLNESNISMFLGAVVIVIVGILVVNFIRDRKEGLTSSINTQAENGTVAKTHKVTKGETLWSIAEDSYGSGYNWVDISKENKLVSDKIEVGQELSLPNVAAKKPTSGAKVVVAEVNKISSENYTVAKGDTLWNIAVRAYGDGYKWVEVAKANKLENPNVIHAGNVITLPR